MIPTGEYILPSLAEFVVTETICPPPVDPNAPVKEKMTVQEWFTGAGISYDIFYPTTGADEIRFHAPYPDDIELVFEPSDHGYVFVFSDGKRVEVP